MRLSLYASTAILVTSSRALTTPSPTVNDGTTIDLVRRTTSDGSMTDDEGIDWLRGLGNGLRSKYGAADPISETSPSKRAGSGTNELINQNMDSSYYGSIAVGTPPTAYNVILDTGSADLWLVSADCFAGCHSLDAFDSSASSTFQNTSTPFSIKYGSGAAAGHLGADTVQMAGFGVQGQTFALCNQITDSLLKDPVSGLMGLGFKTIASSRATPFWQQLVEGGAWNSPVMGFWLTRFMGVQGATKQQLGGAFNMGFTNTSLYTGDIQYTDVPNGAASYWLIPMSGVNINGASVQIGTPYAAIDTGTTLIGGPAAAVAAIFAQIPGAREAGANYNGYYSYPCDTQVRLSISFGNGPAWSINPRDFQLLEQSNGYCIGSLFVLDLSGDSSPTWIIGDTFLKNVYSVFRYSPPSVGFANLSALAISASSVDAPIPTPSIGSNIHYSAAGTDHFGRIWTSSLAALGIASILGARLLL